MTNSKFTVEYDISDLMILLDMYQLGSSTALFYGNKGHKAKLRFQQLAAQIEHLSPLPKNMRSEGYSWLNLCEYLRTYQEEYFILCEESSLGTTICVVCLKDNFRLADRVEWGELPVIVPKLESALKEVAGLDAVQRITEYRPDIWKKYQRQKEKEQN